MATFAVLTGPMTMTERDFAIGPYKGMAEVFWGIHNPIVMVMETNVLIINSWTRSWVWPFPGNRFIS